MSEAKLDVLYVSDFLEKELADILFNKINEEVFEQKTISFKENSTKSPRLIKWYGEKAYAYSGIYHEPIEMPSYIVEIMNKISVALKANNINAVFNSVLINYYRDGNDKINYHSDDETQIGKEPIIASLSLGDSRVFKFKNKETKEIIKYELNHGDLIVMKGKTQDFWQHAISCEANKTVRINLTFRNTLYNPI
jgi:alkylated DNA repair dioxygenase AlkB